MLRVMRNHKRAAYNAKPQEYEGLTVTPIGLDPKYCPQKFVIAAREVWDEAYEACEKYGYRNAQVTVIAPTGTIGLLMDCDTTGIEPDFALVKFKKLAGGGCFKIINQSVPLALKRLGYTDAEIGDIVDYIQGTSRLEGTPWINRETLREKGLRDEELNRIEAVLPSVFDLSFAFTKWILGEDTVHRLGFKPEQYNDPRFNLLLAIGFSKAEIEEANHVICGIMTIEGAPHLRSEHLPILDRKSV